MSIYYQPTESRADNYIRRMAISLVQGYDTMQARLTDLVQRSAEQDGQPKGTGVCDPTFSAVERIQATPEAKALRAIESALRGIPMEYRDVVLEWTKGVPLYQVEGSEFASTTTWTTWRERFLEGVAMNMGWIE